MEVKALRKSMDPERKFKSPLSQGRIDRAYENLSVRLLHTPNQNDFIRTAKFGEYAHAGGSLNPIRELDLLGPKELASEAERYLEGGLEQYLESDTITYLVYGCTRGYTHEIVRTRGGAWFLQQTTRHSDMGDANVRMPEAISNLPIEKQSMWVESVITDIEAYNYYADMDVAYQDCRTSLPIATETWIIVGMPLRTYLNMNAYRTCTMFYPEMVWIQRKVADLVREACPWLANKIKMTCETTKICEYRGVENTHDSCSKPWAHKRRWLSKQFADTGQDVSLSEHNKVGCKICRDSYQQI